MSSESTPSQSMKPYFIVAAIIFVILLIVLLWPNSAPLTTTQPEENNIQTVAEPVEEEQLGVTDMVKPEVFTPVKQPAGVAITADMEVAEFEAEEVTVEVPIDVSDARVKSALLAVAKSPTFGKLLVNEALLQKFVINVDNLAEQKLSPRDTLVVPPNETFKTYNQADRVWIDRKSFTRYTAYVDALESLKTEELLSVYDNYKDVIEKKYAEISRPGANFNNTLMHAIDELLDTPQVPVPIEVYSESVMYKFKDPKLEALSGPQKQLLRTGPENMRRIKKVLRELKTALEER